MDFAFTARCEEYRTRLLDFMDSHVYPAESVYEEEIAAAGNPHHQPKVMEDLKIEARQRGLWNLFHPDPAWGAGLTNAEYAPLAEIMGRSPIASEACNCSAPDTGNMEVLSRFGTPEQQDMWLRPLLEGEIRSAFAMTEPDVASSDATNISMRIERDGDDYVLNGRKWWISGVMHPNCRILIVMGKSDPNAPQHRQQSQILVPLDTPGLTVVRALPTFGYVDHEGHCELRFENVRVPSANMISGEGEGFAIAQARLGPGRIHHCMRSVGAAERALELLCRRALARTTFGRRLAERSNILDWIAEARVDLEMTRLLTLKTAWLMDTVGNKGAHVEISAIKVAAPNVAAKIIDRALQVHGAMGMCDDVPLARMYVAQRALRFADGPDEVHKMSIARRELRRHDPDFRMS
jgi:acyl-CoA dehydrogenase